MVICIIDNDLGGKSVTNDIENVVETICKSASLEKSDCLVVYRDSEGRWDGWDTIKESFIYLNGNSAEEALNTLFTKIEKA